MADDKKRDMAQEEETIDLVELGHVLVDNKGLIIKSTIIYMLLAVFYLLIATPTYQSVALLRVKQGQSIGDSILSSLPAGNSIGTKQQMSTNAEILKSRQVVIPVIEATEQSDEDGKYPEYESYVKKRITTTPFKDTDIMQVAVTAPTAEGAQRTNTLLVEGFLKRLTDLSQSEKKVIRSFIEKRVITAKAELMEAEDKLQAYQSQNKIYSPTDQMKGLTDKIGLIDKAKAENQLNLETAKAALGSVSTQLNTAGISIADSPTIQKYKVQLAELESQKAGLAAKYTNEHPTMKSLNQQIKTVQEALGVEIDKVVAQEAPSSNPVQQGLLAEKFKNEAMIAVAESKATALAELDAATNKEIEKFPEQEKGYIQLKRSQDVAQEIYIMLAKRLEEAKVAEVMVPTEVQVIDTPTLPDKPIAPRKFLTILISFLIGIFVSSGYVIANYLLNRRVRTAADIEKYLGLPVLGLLPILDENGNEIPVKEGFLEKVKRGVPWRRN